MENPLASVRRVVAWLRDLAGAAAALALLVGALSAWPAEPADAAEWTSYTRPARFDVTTREDVPIEMRDGVVLRANVSRPDTDRKVPMILVQTPYNKSGGIGRFLGGSTEYFVERGYGVAIVDVRGTGGSGGVWDSFGRDEQRDGAELVRWANRRPWSTGKVGLWGPSYMAITQLNTAALQPRGLKAIFPIVPLADSYRDIVFSGGQTNVSFIPFWLGLVAAGGLTPPPYALSGDPGDLQLALQALASHLDGTVNFSLASVLDAAVGGDITYDGPFWKVRSPIELVDRIEVPAFLVGGHHDLFQRGTPLIYERLKRRVQAHLLMGPWTHVDGSTGQGLPEDGVPSLDQIALRWFDHWLLGRRTHPGRMPDVTQYVYGKERYETQRDWPDPRLHPERIHLRGDGRLRRAAPPDKEAPQGFVQQPVSGVCTQSTSQWTVGLLEGIPCTRDNRWDELGSAVYTTRPLKRDLELSGPALANLWVKTTAKDAVLTVRITRITPSGASRELTSGWLAASFRKVDPSRSRYVDGRLLQPWHPFTRDSVQEVAPGQAVRMPVEIFPVRATIPKGNRLRVTIGPGDFPHQLPPLPLGLNSLAGDVRILTGPSHPSYVELPGLRGCDGRCPLLPVPNLTRGH